MIKEELRTCPTCSTPLADTQALGLRNYKWVNTKLPGHVGLTDLDGVLERRGHVLIIETKPQGVKIPLGQLITFKTFKKMGCTIWVVWELDDGDCEVGVLDRRGEIGHIDRRTVSQLAEDVVTWYDAAGRGQL